MNKATKKKHSFIALDENYTNVLSVHLTISQPKLRQASLTGGKTFLPAPLQNRKRKNAHFSNN